MVATKPTTPTNMTASELLNFVFACAINDRRALADACHEDDPMHKDALNDCRRFKALRDKLLPLRGPASIREWINSNKEDFETIDPFSPAGRERLREKYIWK